MKDIIRLPYSENQKMILKLIYNKIGITRLELANETGFSALTTTKFVSAFITDGIVSEDGTLESSGGRKAAKLKINADFLYVLAVDIGTYSLKIGITNPSQSPRPNQPLSGIICGITLTSFAALKGHCEA